MSDDSSGQSIADQDLLKAKRDQIKAVIQRPDEGGKRFVCADDVSNVVWRDEGSLAQLFPSPPWNDAERSRIREECIIALSIWVYSGCPFSHELFRQVFFESEYLDDDLPVHEDDFGGLEALGESHADMFRQSQYMFTPCVIQTSRKEGVITVDGARPWPFVEDPEPIGYGGFGEVYQATVAKGCYIDGSMANADNHVIAYKRFSDDRDYRKEVRSLTYLRESLLKHEHIAVHLAAIVHGPNQFYIFLEWTELGDLEVLLNGGCELNLSNSAVDGDPKYNFNEAFGRVGKVHFFEQLEAIASALEFLHEHLPGNHPNGVQCSHLDLRPKNILVYPRDDSEGNVGKWVLADFGISSFKYRQLGEHHLDIPTMGDFADPDRSLTVPHNLQGTHRAPELHELSDRKESPGPKCDIWSFGCIAHEVLVFMTGMLENGDIVAAVSNLRDFRARKKEGYHDDYWFEHEEPRAQKSPALLRKSIQKWFTEIPSDMVRDLPSESTWVENFISLLRDLLQIAPEDRPLASKAVKRLQEIRNQMSFGEAVGTLTPTTPSHMAEAEPKLQPKDKPKPIESSNGLEDRKGTLQEQIHTRELIEVDDGPVSHRPSFPPILSRLPKRNPSRLSSRESQAPSHPQQPDRIRDLQPDKERGEYTTTQQRLQVHSRSQSSSTTSSKSSVTSQSTTEPSPTDPDSLPSWWGPSVHQVESTSEAQYWKLSKQKEAHITSLGISLATDAVVSIQRSRSKYFTCLHDISGQDAQESLLEFVQLPIDTNWDEVCLTSTYLLISGELEHQREWKLFDLERRQELHLPESWPRHCFTMISSSLGYCACIDEGDVKFCAPASGSSEVMTKSFGRDIESICFNSSGSSFFAWTKDAHSHRFHHIGIALADTGKFTFTGSLGHEIISNGSRGSLKNSIWPSQDCQACIIQEGLHSHRTYIEFLEGSSVQVAMDESARHEICSCVLCNDWVVTARLTNRIFSKGVRLEKQYMAKDDSGHMVFESPTVIAEHVKVNPSPKSFRLSAYQASGRDYIVICTREGEVYRFDDDSRTIDSRLC